MCFVGLSFFSHFFISFCHLENAEETLDFVCVEEGWISRRLELHFCGCESSTDGKLWNSTCTLDAPIMSEEDPLE